MKVKVKERVNWPITILLILGLVTVIFPLYLTDNLSESLSQ